LGKELAFLPKAIILLALGVEAKDSPTIESIFYPPPVLPQIQEHPMIPLSREKSTQENLVVKDSRFVVGP
jgi:hypothetical protein